MPYIKQERRKIIEMFAINDASNVGELNFALTNVIKDYMEEKGLCYQTINDILGALEGAKLEFYRRVAVPYEDTKIKENDDVY